MNVVMITVDCLRYDRVGFNGHHRPTTPCLDGLAEESYVFHNAFSTGPQTVDSFPGFIAGRHSYNVARVQDNVSWKALPEGSDTLGSYFSDHGYNTAATLTNTFITEDQNYDIGFDVFENIEMSEFGGPDTGGTRRNSISRYLNRATRTVRSRLHAQNSIYNPYMALFVAYQFRRILFGWPTVHATEVVDEFTSTLDGLTEPFFGWTHLMDLHAPIHPSIVVEELSTVDSLIGHFVAEGARDGHIHHPALNTIYDGTIAYVDVQIGRVFDYLEARGVLDETIVIVTADHGDALYDRGVYGHPAHYLYNELIKVPLLVRTPDGETTPIHEPFSLAWLHELIAELLDWEPASFPAQSGQERHLSPEADDEVMVMSDSISQYGHSVAVQDGTHKYVTHFGDMEMDDRQQPQRDTAYKIASDVGERNPLDGDEAPTGLIRRAEAVHTEPKALPRIGHQADDAVLDRLEQLGYTM